MVEARLRVIYGDTDQMGVVYYANYLRYFEFARSEYFRGKGGSYREMEKDGLFLPVVEATCQYKASARYDDVLVIRTRVSEVKRVTLTFSYEITREGDPTTLCLGKTVHACVDRSGRVCRIPDAMTAIIGES